MECPPRFFLIQLHHFILGWVFLKKLKVGKNLRWPRNQLKKYGSVISRELEKNLPDKIAYMKGKNALQEDRK